MCEGFATSPDNINSRTPLEQVSTCPQPPRMCALATTQRANLLQRPTLVLNRSWLPVHVTTVRRALCTVFRDAARIVCPETLATYDFEGWLEVPIRRKEDTIRSPRVQISAPEIILLARYNRVPSHCAPFTRRNLFLRDDFTCQYCGKRSPADRLSIDHIQPRSRGGLTSWENCVLACRRCNARKADKPPKSAGLRLLRKPMQPRWTPYLNLHDNQRLESWARFTVQPKQRSGRN
jgi:5-methylcytosine-specific restriction endonuclease McrA